MLNRRDAVIGIAALGAGTAYAFWPRTPTENATELPDILDMSANAQTAADVEVVEYTLGDPEAPVKMVEYASFTCPHCASFHANTFKDLKEQYIDTGKVHFTYREVYFDRFGLWAGMVARCAGEDRYFGMVDLIYETQRDWARAGEPADVAAALRKLGLQAGMEPEALDACMQDGNMAQALVARYQENMERDGVRSTPSFLINGSLHGGNMPIAQLSELIEAEL